jgi:hypothetical protein
MTKERVAEINAGWLKVQAATSVLSHALQTMGERELSTMVNSLEKAGTSMVKLFTSGGNDPMAWAQLAISAIDLVSSAWDKFWGKKTKAEQAAEEATASMRQKVERDAEDRILTERQMLQRKYDDEIAAANKLGANTLNIKKYYEGEFAKLDEKALKDQQDATKKALKAIQDMESPWIKAGETISSAMVKGLESGTSKTDFRATIFNMLRNMAIESALAASSFQDVFKGIGKMITEALQDGFISAIELGNIDARVSTAYDVGIGNIQAINGIFDNFSKTSGVASSTTVINNWTVANDPLTIANAVDNVQRSLAYQGVVA